MKLRARLVAREIAKDKREDVFAATPPLESLRMILSECASHQESWDPNENFVIMSNDVSRAYFYAPTTRPIHIYIYIYMYIYIYIYISQSQTKTGSLETKET